ncbi:MAG: hypothetical protein JWQ42_2707 [Edaphobacter sp.]|nr:hypothetical protein [Edaphobacter sp.]
MQTILRILKQAGDWHHGLYLKIEKLFLSVDANSCHLTGSSATQKPVKES